MTDILKRLDELTQKASKVNAGQSQEAASLLLRIYAETGDDEKTANYLMKLKSTVCLDFFELAIAIIEPEKIESLHMAICATESYKKNAAHASTIRVFNIVAVLIKHGQNIARAVLVRTLADVEKNGKFSDAVIKHFNKNVIDYCGIDAITSLGEREWEKIETQDRFYRFIQLVGERKVAVIPIPMNDGKVIEEVSDIAIVEATPQENLAVQGEAIAEETIAEMILTTPKVDDKAVTLVAELLKTLESSNREAQKLHQTLIESNSIDILHKQVSERDTRIAELQAELQESNRRFAELHSSEDKASCLCDEQQNKIAELTEQLKTSMQMGSISQNQELITLKSDLANSLKLEYADYLNDKDTECNPDTFGAFRSSLTRIFKTLRRFGIIIN